MGSSTSREDLPISSKLTAIEIVNRGIEASGMKDLSGKVYIVTVRFIVQLAEDNAGVCSHKNRSQNRCG